jgi:signal transduction histidine kinase/CheY-like chemotaxis protein
MSALHAVGNRLLNGRWITACLALLLLAISLLLGWQSERSAAADRSRQVVVQAQILAGSVSGALAFDDAETAREYLHALKLNPSIRAAALYDADGNLLDGYAASGSEPPAHVSPYPPRVRGGQLSVVVPVRQGELELGSVYVRASIESWTERASRYVGIAIVLVLAAVLIVLLGASNAAAAAANQRLREEIDARESVEEALRQAQKMEAMGQLTGGIAHDFNNLLMAASSGLELLERTQDAAKREKLRTGIREALDRGAKLTEQLLTFARRAPMRKEVLDVHARITSLSDLLDHSLRQDIAVRFKLEPQLWPIEVDAALFDVAILNTAVNARDAMPNGGLICITARNKPAGLNGQDAVEIAIEDDGTGMSPEVVVRVFEPFFTTKEVGRGTGLGLSQVYGFAHSANGLVSISSTEGAGTTVTLLIPRSEASGNRGGPSGELAQAIPTSNLRILLVEDDGNIADLVSQMLEELGCEVTRASSVESGMQQFSKATVDAVLSDMVMPGEGNGLDFARALRRQDPRLPIVLMTGYSQAAGAALEEGFQLLTKPFSMEALTKVVREIAAHAAAAKSIR